MASRHRSQPARMTFGSRHSPSSVNDSTNSPPTISALGVPAELRDADRSESLYPGGHNHAPDVCGEASGARRDLSLLYYAERDGLLLAPDVRRVESTLGETRGGSTNARDGDALGDGGAERGAGGEGEMTQPLRKVVRSRGRYGGYVLLELECGHVAARACTRTEPKRTRCGDCPSVSTKTGGRSKC